MPLRLTAATAKVLAHLLHHVIERHTEQHDGLEIIHELHDDEEIIDEQHYGLEIIKATGVPSGSLYPILSRLEEQGWLTVHEDTTPTEKKAKPRKYYQLTKPGVTQARKALAEFNSRQVTQGVGQLAEVAQHTPPAPTSKKPQEERQMKIVVFFNHAGGSGKTSTARDLSVCLAEKGFRCLLIDCDPQANLTKWMGIDPDSVSKDDTIQNVALGETKDLPAPRSMYGVDVIPSHLDLSGLETAIHAVRMWHYKLKNAVRRLQGYDFVFLDAPASLAPIATMTAIAGELVWVPIPSQDKGLTGIKNVAQMIIDFREANEDLSLGGFVITNHDPRIRHQTVMVEAMKEELGEFPTLGPISYKPAVYGPATSNGVPILKLPPRKEYTGLEQAVQEIRTLTDDFLAVLGMGQVEVVAP